MGGCSITSVMSNSLRPHGLGHTRLLCPWDSPGTNTRVDCHFLLQGIFPTQGSNPRLMSLALAGEFFITSATWEAQNNSISSVQFSSVAQSCPTLCDPMDCSMPGFPVHHQIPHHQIHVHQVSDAIQPSHPLSSPSPPAFNLPQHQGLSKESVLQITWSNYWSFSFNISPSNEYSGLISFRRNM